MQSRLQSQERLPRLHCAAFGHVVVTGRTQIIELVDEALTRWLAAVAPAVLVDLEMPRSANSELTINLSLLGILPERPVASHERGRFQARLQYLVTVNGGGVLERHALLGRLMFAAMEQQAFQAVLEPIRPELWGALGVSPRPAFWVHAPVHLDKAGPSAPKVLEPPVVDVVAWQPPKPIR